LKQTGFFGRKELLFAAIILGLYGCNSTEKITQPIAYNHSIHVSEAGLYCTDCHVGAETKIQATLPSIKRCQTCHSEMQGESKEEAKVVEAVTNKEEIPWNRIYTLPEHVFFSHRRHVTSGKIPCSDCHGDVEKLTKPADHQLVPIQMKRCMNCHDQKSISNDCLTCHV